MSCFLVVVCVTLGQLEYVLRNFLHCYTHFCLILWSHPTVQPITIYAQVMVPKTGKADAIVFVSHGRNEYSDKYHWLFKEEGNFDDKIFVFIDSRGQGASSGFWNYFPSFEASACDVGSVMAKFSNLVDEIPAFWFCHSTGGLIMTCLASRTCISSTFACLLSVFLAGCATMMGSFSKPETLPFEIESYMMSVSINVFPKQNCL